MTLSLFHIPPFLYGFLPALAAAALAVIGYLAARRLVASLGRSSVTRLEAFAGGSGNPRAAGARRTRCACRSGVGALLEPHHDE